MVKARYRIILLFMAAGFLAPSLPPGKTSVAIYPIKAAGATDKSVASALTALLSSELTPSSKLYVLEEGLLKSVMERQGLNMSDACDDTTCQVEIGKLVKAQKMITGDLVKLGGRYILSLKLVDIQTGTLEFTTKDECFCTEDQVDQLINLAAIKIREHFGETGLTVQAPAPIPETPGGAKAFLPVSTAKGYGSIAIATEPAGAEIYLDAELKGKTPMTISQISAGTHSLTLMKKGYSPLPKEIVITANATFPVSERLLKQTGALDITTTPTGAQIYVDDKYMGQAPKKLEGVLAGPHTVKAQAENYQPAEKQVEVGHQQTEAVAIELAGLPGKILVTSIPEGAEVKIDGERKGVTTYTGSLSPGKHRVEVGQEGYDRVQEEVEVAPNKAVTKSYTLQKYTGPVAGEETNRPGAKGGPMVLVPAGEFWMGCNEKVDKECSDDEKPYHKIYLDAFYIDKYEVTQGEYSECVKAGKRKNGCQDNSKYDGFTGERQPVAGVTWDQAKSYCEWAGKRLPTEAEWEKAARGTDGRKYPWGNQAISCSLANYGDCKQGKTVEVGSYASGASPYGALDMAGNVWEWVADWYDKDYYSSSPGQKPSGPSSGTTRVLRGGGWVGNAWDERASYRYGSGRGPAGRFISGGFRCAGDGS